MQPYSGRRIATRSIKAFLTLSFGIAVTSFAPVAAEAQHSGHHVTGRHGAHHAVSSDTPAVTDFKAAHEEMMRAMEMPYTGDPDVDFRQHMIPHHAGAMAMARIALRHARNAWTRQLAESVIYEQQREIAEMQGWLARRGVGVPESGQSYYSWSNEFVRTDV